MTRCAVVLAGGQGKRLRPYTSVLPKPLMPVGDLPILEIVVAQLRRAGFTRITMAVGHLASLIQAYFGDGERFGVTIDYSIERQPLGTAGPLGLLRDRLSEPFLVMNGDVLTDLDFAQLMAEHEASGAPATVAVFHKRIDVALGVLDVDEAGHVTAYTEKPQLSLPVSTGIYAFAPGVLARIAPDQRMDLPDLVRGLIAEGQTVRTHTIEGAWLDIGRPEDYEVAQEDWAAGRFGRL